LLEGLSPPDDHADLLGRGGLFLESIVDRVD
jgi:hypothetical protein